MTLKLSLGVSVSVHGWLSRLSLCGPVMDWRPVQGLPRGYRKLINGFDWLMITMNWTLIGLNWTMSLKCLEMTFVVIRQMSFGHK